MVISRSPSSMNNHASLSPLLVETIAGFTAGIATTIVAHPLDVIKTRLQVHTSSSSTPINSIAVLRSMIQSNRPIQALYRGLTPNIIGNSTSWAIFFYCKSYVETELRIYHGLPSSLAHPHPISGNVWPPTDKQRGQHLSPADYFFAATAAGLVTSVATNPIWVLKTRMVSSDKGSRGAYPTMWAGAKDVWAKEGWKGFYRGLGASSLGVSHGAVQFAVYEPVKRSWMRYSRKISGGRHKPGTGEQKLGNEATVVISFLSKLIAGTTTYPYQVIRARLQIYDAEERFGRGIRGVIQKIWRDDGFRGFYRGIVPNILRVMPSTLVTFLVYENVKFHLPQWAAEETGSV